MLQAKIAGGMTKVVVDVLETIEVQAQDRGLLSVAGRLGQALLHAIFQQQPIGQPGEEIVVRLVNQLLMQLLPVGHVLHQHKAALPALVVDAMRGRVHLNVGAVFAPMAPGTGELGGIGGRIFTQNLAHVLGGPQIGQGNADELFARVAVMLDRRIVDFQDAQGFRIMHPHGMGVRGKKQPIVLGSAPDRQELVFEQGHDHAEGDKILGHVPQLRGNLPGADKRVANQSHRKDRSPGKQTQDGGQYAGRLAAEVEPVEGGKG